MGVASRSAGPRMWDWGHGAGLRVSHRTGSECGITASGIPALEDMQRLVLYPDSRSIDKQGEKNML